MSRHARQMSIIESSKQALFTRTLWYLTNTVFIGLTVRGMHM